MCTGNTDLSSFKLIKSVFPILSTALVNNIEWKSASSLEMKAERIPNLQRNKESEKSPLKNRGETGARLECLKLDGK